MAKNVRLYVVPNCDRCRAARDYLDARGIEYTLLDISVEEVMEELLVQHRTMGTPTFVIGNEVIQGIDEARIETALAGPD